MGDLQTDAGVPGYFVGKPANLADQQPKAAADEPKPANTPIPGDYFVGTPQNRQQQHPAAEPAQPAGELKRSRSYLPCFPCLGGGAVAN
ncbi:hypothetical protein ACP4OV_015180 [Aristida adscensionis]